MHDSPPTATELACHRRAVIVKRLTVTVALARQRREPPWFLGVERTLLDLFGPIGQSDSWATSAANDFLTNWLELIADFPDIAVLPWPDPDGEDGN